MNVLVVGGAGYIGSHCVRQLEAAGHRPVVLDNLVFGHRKAVSPGIPFYEVDLGDLEAVGPILRDEKIELVMHFAAFAYVGESVTEPRKYYENNFVATLRLLETMLDNNVKKFVFSSTCATYGEPESLPIVETLRQAPINPYGQTKLDVENCLKAFAHAYGLSFAAFRYFNAAGASEDGTIGEDHKPESHIIPLVIDAATRTSRFSAPTIRLPMAPVCGTTYMLTTFPARTSPCSRSWTSQARAFFITSALARPNPCAKLSVQSRK
jgi:UDP-glucose 4-epimerase